MIIHIQRETPRIDNGTGRLDYVFNYIIYLLGPNPNPVQYNKLYDLHK